MTSIKRLVLCNLVAIPTILPLFLISKKSGYWTVVILRQWLPPTMSMIFHFGFSKQIALYFGLANAREENPAQLIKYMRSSASVDLDYLEQEMKAKAASKKS